MLKIVVTHWKCQELLTTDPEKFEFLRAHCPKMPEAEKFKASYESFEGWVNSADDIPEWLMNICAYEKPQAMNLLKPDGSLSTSKLMDAVKMNQIHLPDMKLLNIKSAFVLENACTERLNEELEGGACIIAVCLQTGQRRPDYVLGRL